MHLEVLNSQGKIIFPRLKSFSTFYLAGGTALALQIGHRISVDFDLFTDKEIGTQLLLEVEKTFSDKKLSVSVNNREELTILIGDTKLTFLFYPFPIIQKLENLHGQKALGVSEVIATKAYTVGRRGSYKDYVDIYYAISENLITLEEIIRLAEKKYQIQFNGRLFLEQLVFLKDIQDTEILFIKKSITKSEIAGFFEEKIKNLQF